MDDLRYRLYNKFFRVLIDTQFVCSCEVIFPLPEWMRSSVQNPSFDGRVEIASTLEEMFFYHAKREVIMAYQKGKKSNFIDWTMMNVEITEAEKKAFTAWYQTNVGKAEELLAKAMNDGYKLSVSYSFNQGRFYATYSQCNPDMPDYQTSLSSHANGWIKAIFLTHWKIYVLGSGVIKSREPKADEDDIG